MEPILIGISLAVPFLAVSWWTGLGKERAFYATLLMAIAFFYPVFAIGTDSATLAVNTSIAALFIGAAFYGYVRRPLVLPVALAVHAGFDVGVAQLGTPAPSWWAGLCIGADLTLAVGAFLTLKSDASGRIGWRTRP
ncbi:MULTISPECIES: hypothetical protein [Parvularcula]|uniref:Uncharacterized protein n=1 Tax=Parvularcula dongshanensis TaxID=1173995 RepID=A0A840I7I1_9PROT|nr:MULTISPECIES: hypothetical protein [Parvularcula]MBB4660231.1 hypothetical protein [Parvularcula dongshanensis]